MKDLHKSLNSNYQKIKFKISKTQHLLIKATVNGVKGDFILDTGASNSCVGFEEVAYFDLITSKTKTKASGAGAIGMKTLLAKKNKIKIGKWKSNDMAIIVFDLSHVNHSLQQHNAKPVHGIIGADVLMKGKAIIDYYNHCFYLKKSD